MFRMSLFMMFIIIVASGCTVADDEPKKLRELYPGNILHVDHVSLTNGSSGEKSLSVMQYKFKSGCNLYKT